MTLPGVTEAAERGDWAAAREQAALVAGRAGQEHGAPRCGLGSAGSRLARRRRSLESRVRTISDRVDGRMAVYVEHLGTGERVAIDADTEYETFSVIKVPIMATVLEQVRQGTLKLDQRVPMRADQRRIPVRRALRARSGPAADRARPAHADDHHQRQPGDRRVGGPGRPRERDEAHGQPGPGAHEDPILGSGLGSPVAVVPRPELEGRRPATRASRSRSRSIRPRR